MNANESQCPVDKVIGLFNKKWNLQIIRDMFFGKKRFKEFQEDKPKLSNKVLSQCLKDMESKGLIEKRIIETSPIRSEYYLTEYGQSLNKVIYEIAMFSLESGFEEYTDETLRKNIKENFKETLNIKD